MANEIALFVRDGFGTLVWCQPQERGGWRCGLCRHWPLWAIDSSCNGCKAPVYREQEVE